MNDMISKCGTCNITFCYVFFFSAHYDPVAVAFDHWANILVNYEKFLNFISYLLLCFVQLCILVEEDGAKLMILTLPKQTTYIYSLYGEKQ